MVKKLVNDSLPAIGVVVAVDTDVATVGVYNVINDPSFIVNGELISGVRVGAFLLVKQGRFRIVTKVVSEKVRDQQNTIKSTEFDNRFKPESIQRILRLKVQGVIDGDSHFEITTSKVPMVGNEVYSATENDLAAILAVPGEDKNKSILIGNSILEGLPVYLPIDAFFASHIGIFGNTGSGKSNTLHKLYWELFKSQYGDNALARSHFFIIDFTGEYTKGDIFSGVATDRDIFTIDSLNKESEVDHKLPMSEEFFFSLDTLSMLLNATVSTQIPFLKSVCEIREGWGDKGPEGFASCEIGLLKKLLSGTAGKFEFTRQWIQRVEEFLYPNTNTIDNSALSALNKVETMTGGHLKYGPGNNDYINGESALSDDACRALNLKEVQEKLKGKYSDSDEFEQFYILSQLELIYDCAFGKTKADYIGPLITRMRNKFNAFKITRQLVHDDTNTEKSIFKPLTIISLAHADKELKTKVPMLFSQFIYSEQKRKTIKDGTINSTTHLIIDEAHNILQQPRVKNFDQWEDYRVKCFEDIIKEGRKFGFFLTLASQRPADISSTIISQIHNFIIHRIVNDRDLQMLDNAMPTLDEYSKVKIPSLGKGEAVLTGTAFNMPALIKIPFEKESHPNSDDVKLTSIWDTDKS